MIVGVVSVQGLPTIILPIAGRDWPATIDTGFNGDLELPAALREPLNAQFVGRARAALAGGQSVEEDLYLVEFPLVQAEATFVPGSRILIGTRLLREYSLQIDFVNRTVRLARASLIVLTRRSSDR